MPQPGQTSVTLKSSTYKLAEEYVKEHNKTHSDKKSVAGFITELILEKIREA